MGRRDRSASPRRSHELGLDLTSAVDWLAPYGLQSYAVIFAVLIACGFGFPMPEDILLITGGVLSAREVLDFWATVGVCLGGVILGDGAVYFLGRTAGLRFKRSWLGQRFIKPAVDARVAGFFVRYGQGVIFMGRFMPGFRMPIFFSAGMYRIPAWRFFALDGTAALISVPVWVYVGHVFGKNLEKVEEVMGTMQQGILAGVVCVIAAAILWIWLGKRRAALPRGA